MPGNSMKLWDIVSVVRDDSVPEVAADGQSWDFSFRENSAHLITCGLI